MTHRSGKIILTIGIVLIALNLRPSLAAIGPLISDIRASTGLSNTWLGFLTTLPLLCFGLLSTSTPVFTRKMGLEGTLTFALIVLTAGIIIRIISDPVFLFAGTLLIGIGIALGNVLLPSLVKRNFQDYAGVMTSLYSGMLGVGAALAAGLSVPLARDLNWGWELSMGFWAIPSAVALLVWIPQLRSNEYTDRKNSISKALKHLGRSGMAWNIALFMGLQSFSFYVILAWLPDILIDNGLSASRAGWMLSLSQAAGVLGSFIIPTLAEKFSQQKWIVVLLGVFEAISILGLIFLKTSLIPYWVILLGISLGGSFGLALLFIVLRSADTQTTTELSGMSQSIGYLLASIGPMMIGGIFDLSRSWTIPLVLLFLIVLIKSFFGFNAGQNKEIN